MVTQAKKSEGQRSASKARSALRAAVCHWILLRDELARSNKRREQAFASRRVSAAMLEAFDLERSRITEDIAGAELRIRLAESSLQAAEAAEEAEEAERAAARIEERREAHADDLADQFRADAQEEV